MVNHNLEENFFVCTKCFAKRFDGEKKVKTFSSSFALFLFNFFMDSPMRRGEETLKLTCNKQLFKARSLFKQKSVIERYYAEDKSQ